MGSGKQRGHAAIPQSLYGKEPDPKFRSLVGSFAGILDNSLMFWEVVDVPAVRKPRTEGWDEKASLYCDVEYWIVGKDKRHAHLTAVNISRDPADQDFRKRVLKDLGSDEEIGTKYPGLGFLILGSRPSFLSGNAPETSSSVYLAENQNSHLPPYRVLYPSISGKGWNMTTIGGIFAANGHMFGIIMQSRHYCDPGVSGEVPLQILPISKGKGHPKDGLVADSDPSASPLPTSKSTTIPALNPGKRLGKALPDRHPLFDGRGLCFLVRLDDNTPIPNVITAPNTFGDTFTLTEFKEPTPGKQVWIMSSSAGILVGRVGRPSTGGMRIDNDPTFYAAEMDSKLAPEDCGSWVIDGSSRSLVGIIFDETGLFCSWTMVTEMLPALGISWSAERRISLPHRRDIPRLSDQIKSNKNSDEVMGLEEAETPNSTPRTSFLATLCSCWSYEPKELKKKTGFDSSSFGNPLGTTGSQQVWELRGDAKKDWQALRPKIEDLVRRTPSKSRSMPTVMLNAVLIGTRDHAVPKIMISSSSKTYSTQLEKAIRQNGTLKSTNFEIMTLDSPLDTSNIPNSFPHKKERGLEFV